MKTSAAAATVVYKAGQAAYGAATGVHHDAKVDFDRLAPTTQSLMLVPAALKVRHAALVRALGERDPLAENAFSAWVWDLEDAVEAASDHEVGVVGAALREFQRRFGITVNAGPVGLHVDRTGAGNSPLSCYESLFTGIVKPAALRGLGLPPGTSATTTPDQGMLAVPAARMGWRWAPNRDVLLVDFSNMLHVRPSHHPLSRAFGLAMMRGADGPRPWRRRWFHPPRTASCVGGAAPPTPWSVLLTTATSCSARGGGLPAAQSGRWRGLPKGGSAVVRRRKRLLSGT